MNNKQPYLMFFKLFFSECKQRQNVLMIRTDIIIDYCKHCHTLKWCRQSWRQSREIPQPKHLQEVPQSNSVFKGPPLKDFVYRLKDYSLNLIKLSSLSLFEFVPCVIVPWSHAWELTMLSILLVVGTRTVLYLKKDDFTIIMHTL